MKSSARDEAGSRHHEWAWPEDYAGAVWMEIAPQNEDAGKDIYFHAQWGSKMRLTVCREVAAEPFVLFFRKGGTNRASQPAPLGLNFSHKVAVRFGTIEDLPVGAGRYYDFNRQWHPGNEHEERERKTIDQVKTGEGEQKGRIGFLVPLGHHPDERPFNEAEARTKMAEQHAKIQKSRKKG